MKVFAKKLENISLFLFLLLIPTQLGKHFWPEWSLVLGVRVDYLSPILYLTDIVWSLWIMTKIFNFKFKIYKQKPELINFQNILVAVFVLVNILIAGNKWVAVYKWIRIGQWIITFKEIQNSKLKTLKNLKSIIPWWIGVESLLGLAQMIKGGSLNGIWYWLGERRFDFSSIGVAQISIAGEGLIRAYGTFSHPNSLAGFLLVSLILWTRYKKSIGWWIVFWLGVVGIIITGSRTVWLLGILLPIITNYKLLITNYKKAIGYGLVAMGVVLVVLGIIGANYRMADFVGGWDSDSLAKRVNLNMVGIKMWRENFFLGVGAGNFIPKLPEYQSQSKFYWLQPIHNIFLLAGVEIGMLGIILIIKLLITNDALKGTSELRIKRRDYLILGTIIVTGMVDHYWITLPQNVWLLAVVFGIM